MSPKQVYELDGAEFASLDGFFDEISKKLIPNAKWGRNLDAFNDVLRGGFGTLQEGFVPSLEELSDFARAPRVC